MTPLILAVDTTHEHGSLALVRGVEVIEEVAVHSPAGFAQVIYGELERLLQRNGVRVPDIDCFAAASGPGSFTGVRVGLACIKGLAEAAGKPALGVSNLRALASFGTGPLRAALIDARRGEIYGAVYDAEGAAIVPETVANLARWLESLPRGVEFVSTDFAFAGGVLDGVPKVAAPRALAGAVAKIAAAELARGGARDPAGLDANYVRLSDAELYWKEG